MGRGARAGRGIHAPDEYGLSRTLLARLADGTTTVGELIGRRRDERGLRLTDRPGAGPDPLPGYHPGLTLQGDGVSSPGA
ncbi:hypothetical protein BZZ08_07115 [Streptomyces sp. MH60]|nr:hypothetical protein BZZ08_07115 [Streptomyces sp. MH60]